MPGTIPAARQHLIDDIAKLARRKRRAALPLPAFVQAYYRGVGEEDLQLRDAAAFAAAAAGHLEFGTLRRAGEPKVRVFNPEQARDGWESPYTIVEVVTDDMPFLVDSLAVVLGDSRLAIAADDSPGPAHGPGPPRQAAEPGGAGKLARHHGIVAARGRAPHR